MISARYFTGFTGRRNILRILRRARDNRREGCAWHGRRNPTAGVKNREWRNKNNPEFFGIIFNLFTKNYLTVTLISRRDSLNTPLPKSSIFTRVLPLILKPRTSTPFTNVLIDVQLNSPLHIGHIKYSRVLDESQKIMYNNIATCGINPLCMVLLLKGFSPYYKP